MSWASLSLKNLTNALREVDDWEDLGIQLDVQYHELQKFVSEHQKIEERKRAMLQFWLDHDTKASWTRLITALSEMKLNRVAEEIKRKYQMPPSTQSEDAPLLVPTVTAEPENVPTTASPTAPPTDQLYQTRTTQSENVIIVDPSAIQLTNQPLSTQSESVPTAAPPSAPPTDQLYQTRTTQSENVIIVDPSAIQLTNQPLSTQSESVPTAAPPSAPPTDQLYQTRTTQSENVIIVDPSAIQLTNQPLSTQSESVPTADPPSTTPTGPPTHQPEETSTEGVRKVQLEIATLVAMYDELVARTVENFSERQEESPIFFRKLRTTVAVLPTSLKYQHHYFLEQHFSQIARATTVEEIFSILNRYWNFLNCSLLSYIITKFGDEELQKQLSTYTTALQAFRSRTKITDFIKICAAKQINVPEFAVLKTKLSPDWKDRTLEDAEVYRMSMVHSSSLASYALYVVEGVPGSIYLLWSVPSHAIDFLAAAMNSEFLQHHCIEEVTIDGEDLEEYKRRRSYIFYFPGPHFGVINQVI